jgi:uncharacterized protein
MAILPDPLEEEEVRRRHRRRAPVIASTRADSSPDRVNDDDDDGCVRVPAAASASAAAGIVAAEDATKGDEEEAWRRMTDIVLSEVTAFYERHSGIIHPSHGIRHVLAVYRHARRAVAALRGGGVGSDDDDDDDENDENDEVDEDDGDDPPKRRRSPRRSRAGTSSRPVDATAVVVVPPRTRMEILVAALLHDVDDHKYFPHHSDHENARRILLLASEAAAARAAAPSAHCSQVGSSSSSLSSSSPPSQLLLLLQDSIPNILYMISLVGCTENGNRIPAGIEPFLLIPRWADRLEAVGKVGVVRCYLYNRERNLPLISPQHSPRPTSVGEVWAHATPERFEAYQSRDHSSADMISHYYDKLLHVARPPPEIVQNPYLERMAETVASKELVEVCLRYGKEGIVDEGYIRELAEEVGINIV